MILQGAANVCLHSSCPAAACAHTDTQRKIQGMRQTEEEMEIWNISDFHRKSKKKKKKRTPIWVSERRTFLTADLFAPALHRLRHRAGCDISKRHFLFCSQNACYWRRMRKGIKWEQRELIRAEHISALHLFENRARKWGATLFRRRGRRAGRVTPGEQSQSNLPARKTQRARIHTNDLIANTQTDIQHSKSP